VPLDGFLDPYFQAVYLDAESIPIFSKLVKELSADTVKDPNFGKVARRLYNSSE
jgi:hypothetical protein